VIAMTRYRVPDADDFLGKISPVLTALEAAPGFLYGRIGRNADEPDLWVLVTEWEGAGFYRRALGAWDVRLAFVPLSTLAIDESGAYEVVKAE
jgi:hypothetical protein